MKKEKRKTKGGEERGMVVGKSRKEEGKEEKGRIEGREVTE